MAISICPNAKMAKQTKAKRVAPGHVVGKSTRRTYASMVCTVCMSALCESLGGRATVKILLSLSSALLCLSVPTQASNCSKSELETRRGEWKRCRNGPDYECRWLAELDPKRKSCNISFHKHANLRLARLYFEEYRKKRHRSDKDRAWKYFRVVERDHGMLGTASLAFGRLHAVTNEYDKAIPFLTKAIHLRVKKACFYRGEVYFSAATGNASPENSVRMAAHTDKKRMKRAIADYRSCITLKRFIRRSRIKLAAALLRSNLIKEAQAEIVLLKHQLKRKNGRARGLVWRLEGIALYRQNLNDQALVSFNRAVKADARSGWSLVWRARVRNELGDREGFQQDLLVATVTDDKDALLENGASSAAVAKLLLGDPHAGKSKSSNDASRQDASTEVVRDDWRPPRTGGYDRLDDRDGSTLLPPSPTPELKTANETGTKKKKAGSGESSSIFASWWVVGVLLVSLAGGYTYTRYNS